MRSLVFVLTMIAFPLALGIAMAEAKLPDPTSPEFPAHVMRKLDDLYRGASSQGVMKMKVNTKHWTRSMSMENWSLGKDFTLVRILKPRKEKGTATLKVHNNLFIYLNKTGRTIKISSGMMGGSWMGSHFTNDDLIKHSRFARDYVLKLSGQGEEQGTKTYRFTLKAKPDAPVVWDKLVVTVRQVDLQPLWQAYYDEDGKKIRVLSFFEHKHMSGRVMPLKMVMKQLDKPGEFTEVSWKEIRFDVKLDKNFFSLQKLPVTLKGKGTMRLSKMAWRNLWRNRRRTIVTVAAMTLALVAMILYSGLAIGYLEGAERNLLDLQLGDMQIHARGYRDKPSLYTQIEGANALLARLEKAGFRASASLLGGGLAAAGDASAGVAFHGVDIERAARVGRLHDQMAQGQWLDPRHPKGVVIGRKLARTLEVELGDELVVLTQGSDGSMANELYRVRGLLKGINAATDRGGIYMTEKAFRELLVLPEGAHRIVVRRPEALPLAAAIARVKALAPGLEIKSWRQLKPMLASMLDSAQAVMYTMFLIVSLAIGIVILNAMLMAVFERIREFGVLKALGMGPGKVLRLILLETALQTGLAALLGAAIAAPALLYLARVGLHMEQLSGTTIQGIAWDPVWRASISTSTFTGPISTLGFVVFVAVLYPGIKAALIRPVAAMQHR